MVFVQKVRRYHFFVQTSRLSGDFLKESFQKHIFLLHSLDDVVLALYAKYIHTHIRKILQGFRCFFILPFAFHWSARTHTHAHRQTKTIEIVDKCILFCIFQTLATYITSDKYSSMAKKSILQRKLYLFNGDNIATRTQL